MQEMLDEFSKDNVKNSAMIANFDQAICNKANKTDFYGLEK